MFWIAVLIVAWLLTTTIAYRIGYESGESAEYWRVRKVQDRIQLVSQPDDLAAQDTRDVVERFLDAMRRNHKEMADVVGRAE